MKRWVQSVVASSLCLVGGFCSIYLYTEPVPIEEPFFTTIIYVTGFMMLTGITWLSILAILTLFQKIT